MKIASITYARGATVNRGNFNSERLDLSVTVETDGEDADQVYEKAKEWVKVRVQEHIKLANKGAE